jgi:hypothetical protein
MTKASHLFSSYKQCCGSGIQIQYRIRSRDLNKKVVKFLQLEKYHIFLIKIEIYYIHSLASLRKTGRSLKANIQYIKQ